MRLVQVVAPEGKLEAIINSLEEQSIDYFITDETSGEEYAAIVLIPLPTTAVEPVLEELRGVGVDENTYTIVAEAEAVISESFEVLEEEYQTEAEETEPGITGDIRIAREELASRARDLVLAWPTYAVLTLISAIIATAGLLMDSPATVVGSMVIAPLIGPSLAASVGTVIGDEELFHRGVKLQILGVLVAIVGAALFGLLVRFLLLVPPGMEVMAFDEISERAAPSFLILAIALGAGAAGILSLMTGVSTALVGVMIAVALIPPAAAVGVGIAFGVPRLALGASVIVSVNVLSINLSSLAFLWFEGYRPASWFRERAVRGALIRQILVLVLAIGLVSVFLVGVTYDSYVASTTEEDIRDGVEMELDTVDEELQLREIQVERTGIVPPLETDRVIIQVAVSPDSSIPPLLERITERVEHVTGDDVEVEVEFMFVQRPG